MRNVGYQYLRPAYYQSTGAANGLEVWKTDVCCLFLMRYKIPYGGFLRILGAKLGQRDMSE